MGSVVYCWENGANQGHVVPARPVLAELRRRGHAVSAVLKDMRPAESAFAGLDVRCYQAPVHHGKPPADRTASRVAWQLEAAGLGRPGASAGAFRAWRSLFRLLDPDVALLDYSPLAALALRGTRTRAAQFGTGICCPPGRAVPWAAPAGPDAAGPEDRGPVLDTLNHHLRSAGEVELARVSDLFAGLDETFLTTYPELDHYRDQRAGARYWGVWADPDAAPPEWPAGPARRAFAYVHWFEHLHVLLDLFRAWRVSAVVCGYGMPDAVRDKFSGGCVRLVNRRVSLPRAAAECDFAVTNGNHGSTAYLLRRGVPLFMVPLQKEQEFTARRVAESGAGRWAPPDQPGRFARELGTAALSDEARAAALRVSAGWAGVDADAGPARVADRVEELMAAGPR